MINGVVKGSKRFAILYFFIVALLSSSFSASAADDWNDTIAKAKKEGIVVVHGAPGTTYRDVMVTAFNSAFPEIKVQFSGAPNSLEVARVIRERQANIYSFDVWVSGPSGALAPLKPIGFFDPLAPALRPEIMADDKWAGGFSAGWLDSEKKVFYAFDGTVQMPVLVNWDFLPAGSIKSLNDLAKPEFSGKIVMFDPRTTGPGNGMSHTVFRTIGVDGLKAIYQNNVVFTTNAHQIGEWAVRGRYPVSIGLEPQTVSEFQAQGLGKNIRPLPDELFKIQQIAIGFGGVGLVNRAPHPNAARVYINWLLSKDGQQTWTTVPRNSRRTDVKQAFPELVPKADRSYFLGPAEEFNAERSHLISVAKEAIDGAPPR